MGIGFTLALSLLGAIREILGSGSFLGIPFASGLEQYTQTLFILAPGGFRTLGLLMGFFNYLAIRKRNKEGPADGGVETAARAEWIHRKRAKNSVGNP